MADSFPFFLADDLSGALDAAGGFFKAGWPVRIVLSPAGWSDVRPGELIGCTTETRNAAPRDAARIVVGAIADGQARGGRLVYKKIDSTLRGAVAAELAAVLAALPAARVLFAPANPRVGRTVRAGVLLVRGVPVAETEFARDPVSPVRESAIPRLLEPAIDGAAEGRVVIVDVETDADLEAAVAQMSAASGTWIGVGSGALAVPVARWLARAREGSASMPPRAAPGFEPAPKQQPVLIVCGSAHPANREQAACALRERGVTLIEVNPVGGMHGEARYAAARARAERAAGRSVALLLAPRGAANPVSSDVALEAIATAAVGALGALSVADYLGRAAAASRGPALIFATGGETARTLALRLGIASLVIRREVAAGLVLAEAAATEALPGGVLMAVKPGGFGEERAWIQAHDALVGA